MKRMLIALVTAFALAMSVAPAADAGEYWIKKREWSSSARQSGKQHINVYQTEWYRSGTTRPHGRGKKIIQPKRTVLRYVQGGESHLCDGFHELKYINFTTRSYDYNGKNWVRTKRRLVCDESGQNALIIRWPAATTPVFRYQDGKPPVWRTHWEAEVANEWNPNGDFGGKYLWMGVSLPFTRHKVKS